MDAEDVLVLYDFDYDYKDRRITIRKDEKLKLLQRTNQHWWKVLRPGVNRAFFVPAQYVKVFSESSSHDGRNKSQIQNTEETSSLLDSEKIHSGNKDVLTDSTIKMKRGESIRSSKKGLKSKNWSASLEELSKQIKFPGINITESESVMNLNVSSSNPSTSSQPLWNEGKSKWKPVPLPRKLISKPLTPEELNGNILPPPPSSFTPKPIPKQRQRLGGDDGGIESSGGSTELLTTSSEEIILSATPPMATSENYDDDGDEESLGMKGNILYEREGPMGDFGVNGRGFSPTSSTTSPRRPSAQEKALRPISEHWSEYLNSDRRIYYYNSLTGATSWKPPRINSIIHHPSPINTNYGYDGGCLVDTEKLYQSNNRESIPTREDEQMSFGEEEVGGNIPKGWSFYLDPQMGQTYYVNDQTGAKVLIVMACNGRNRATIAIVPSLRRSMSETDLHGVAELIKSVGVPKSNVSYMKKKWRGSYDSRSLELGNYSLLDSSHTNFNWNQLISIMKRMKRNRNLSLWTWLGDIRNGPKDEDEQETSNLLQDLLPSSSDYFLSMSPSTSEELMEKISPEAATVLRQILKKTSWTEEINISSETKGHETTKCSCQMESNGIHWADCESVPLEIETEEEEEWLSSEDGEGNIYYYEENSTKSSWFLPVPQQDQPSTPMSKSTASGSREISPRPQRETPVSTDIITKSNSVSPGVVKKRHSAGEVGDRFKARSLLILHDSTRNTKAESSKLGSLPRSQVKSIWTHSRDEETIWMKVIREGSLTRTKITENGKKLRKNWSSVYVVLTDEHLSLFKDEKSFGIKKSEMEIELSGSTVDWSCDKTSRKHVFQLNTAADLQILFQGEDEDICRRWIEDIQEVIKRQPVRELLRLRSTSPDPYMENSVVGEKKISSRLGRAKSSKLRISESVENLTSEEKNKIRAQLKKFFNRRPGRESLVKKGIYKDEAVFGCLLEKLCSREGTDVPNFVQQAVAAIEIREENLKTDGIYRASGNLSQVQKIRFQVDQNNLACLYQEDDVHVLAGALKLFFREMREPLIPTELFTEALNAATSPLTKKEKIGKFRDIIGKLAKTNRMTLHFLLKHLLRVSEYSDSNRMLIPNLAIVFGPTLMWPATESTNMALDLMQQNYVIEALLLDFYLIFETRR